MYVFVPREGFRIIDFYIPVESMRIGKGITPASHTLCVCIPAVLKVIFVQTLASIHGRYKLGSCRKSYCTLYAHDFLSGPLRLTLTCTVGQKQTKIKYNFIFVLVLQVPTALQGRQF